MKIKLLNGALHTFLEPHESDSRVAGDIPSVEYPVVIDVPDEEVMEYAGCYSIPGKYLVEIKGALPTTSAGFKVSSSAWAFKIGQDAEIVE